MLQSLLSWAHELWSGIPVHGVNFSIKWPHIDHHPNILCPPSPPTMCPEVCVQTQAEKPWLYWIASSSSLLNSVGLQQWWILTLHEIHGRVSKSVPVFWFKFYTQRTHMYFKSTFLILAAEPFSCYVATENSGKMFERGWGSCSASLGKAEIWDESMWPLR